MDFTTSLYIAAAGMRAQSGRMRVIAENLANADSVSATGTARKYTPTKVSTNLGDSKFGQVTSAFEPRIFQLGMKIVF